MCRQRFVTLLCTFISQLKQVGAVLNSASASLCFALECAQATSAAWPEMPFSSQSIDVLSPRSSSAASLPHSTFIRASVQTNHSDASNCDWLPSVAPLFAQLAARIDYNSFYQQGVPRSTSSSPGSLVKFSLQERN